MPANLSPEYKSAETAFRRARDPEERLDCLRAMLRTIPKHKGTERLQADIKTRIKQLGDEVSGPRKGAARGGPPLVIRPEGAAQVAIVGPPNVGKSTLHHRLTGSNAGIGPYPYTTQHPQPGMLAHEDIHFQLVDLPPLAADHPVPWIGNALQPAEACLLVADLREPACVEQVQTIRALLQEKHVTLLERARGPALRAEDDDAALGDPFAIRLPTLVVMNKTDVAVVSDEEQGVFNELIGADFPALAVSAERGTGLDGIAPWLFRELGVVRVYTKAPNRPPDMQRPFTLRRGDTVQDVALLVHKDLAESLRFARLWGDSGQFDGQQVGREHPVADGDVLELHA